MSIQRAVTGTTLGPSIGLKPQAWLTMSPTRQADGKVLLWNT